MNRADAISAFYVTAANLYDLGAVKGIIGLQEVFPGA